MNKGRAVVLPDYNDNLLRAMLSLRIEEREIPVLSDDEVLVKMEGATCNPSDIAFLRGGYNVVKPIPCVPGFEGTGTVIETGNNAGELSGKRVSCFVQEEKDGTWADYFVAKSKDCTLIHKDVPMEQAACISINPLTAWGMFELVKKSGTKVLIQNAAAGQVPRIIQQLAGKFGVEVINIVRKTTTAEGLTKAGIKYVIATDDDNYRNRLTDLCQKLQPGIAFDAVGGMLTGEILNAMPTGAQMVIYGALSGEPVSDLNSMGVIFHKKSVIGFNLNEWLENINREEFLNLSNTIQDMIIKGELNTSIQGTFKLDEIVMGLRTYIKSMSTGKIVFTP